MYKLAIIGALILTLVGTGLLHVYMQRFETEKSGGSPVAVVVVAQSLKRGATVAESSITVREIPAAYVDSRAVRASEKKKIVGVRVLNAVQAGQTLTWTDVAAAGERRLLSSLVQPGFRAFNMKTRADAATFELIEPGDRVDLISTLTGAGGQRTSSLLLQNVLVLAVGTNTGDEASVAAPSREGASKKEQVLTLSLKPESAQLLALAMDKGTVSVAVRNPDDVRVIDGASDVAQSAVEAPARIPVTALSKPAPAMARR